VAGGDPGILAEVAGVFRGDWPARVAELRQGLAAGDAARIERVAHTLKGALASLGAGAAQALAAELESMGQNDRLGGADRVVDRLEREL
jgi:HPt (histidine-containing phosphotransfer) domain-containing protein